MLNLFYFAYMRKFKLLRHLTVEYEKKLYLHTFNGNDLPCSVQGWQKTFEGR